MRAKAKKRGATALASSGRGGKVCPPNECSVAEGDVKVDVPVQVLVHVVAYIIPIMAQGVSLHWWGGHTQRGDTHCLGFVDLAARLLVAVLFVARDFLGCGAAIVPYG